MKLCIIRGEQIGSVLIAMGKTQPKGEWQHSLGVGPGLHEKGTPCCDVLHKWQTPQQEGQLTTYLNLPNFDLTAKAI